MRKKIGNWILVFSICASILAGTVTTQPFSENDGAERNTMAEYPIEQYCDGPDGVMLQ